jgi:recombination protein RecT
MSVKTDQSGRIVKPAAAAVEQKRESTSLAGMLQDPKMVQEIARALPKHITPDRIVRIVMTALRTTRDLAKCTPESFMGCVLTSAQLGLEVNTPMQHAWLIPRKNGALSRAQNKEVIECKLIVGYQGMIELSMRSGRIAGINAQVVREGDFFEYELGLTPKLVHRHGPSADREEKPITHAYAVARIKDAEPVFEVLSAAQLQARAGRSSAGGSGPWTTDIEAMCRKTAARALWKWIPKSAEMATADYVETAAETGKPQTSAFGAEVHAALANVGLEPIDTTVEPETQHDPHTGEVKQQEGGDR